MADDDDFVVPDDLSSLFARPPRTRRSRSS